MLVVFSSIFVVDTKIISRKSPYLSVSSPIAGNADQNNSEYGNFSRSEYYSILLVPLCYLSKYGNTFKTRS